MRASATVFVGLLLLVLVAPDVYAQEAPPRSVTVSATDTVRVTPDRVIVRFAVVTRSPQAEAAHRQNEEASRRVLDAVRQIGIPERQIQVQMLRLHEEVEHRQGRRVRVGFMARRDVQVIIDDMERVPVVVSRVVEEGATEFGGISYELRDYRAQENEALRRAALRAREKADVLAATLGMSVRAVHSITEAGVAIPRWPMPGMRVAAEALDLDLAVMPEAFAPGEIEVRASVVVIFELE